MDAEYLTVMGKLGNAAIHPHDGGIEPQRAFDASFLRDIETFFVGLLDEVYEVSARKAANLARLKGGLAAFDTPD